MATRGQGGGTGSEKIKTTTGSAMKNRILMIL